jgi:hypothetical protein
VVVCTAAHFAATNPCDFGNVGERTPALPVGGAITVGRFRCRILSAGVQCTVIATGDGFLFGAQTVTAVGGASLRRTTSVPTGG